jgi:hypothetical protein
MGGLVNVFRHVLSKVVTTVEMWSSVNGPERSTRIGTEEYAKQQERRDIREREDKAARMLTALKFVILQGRYNTRVQIHRT